MTMGGSGLIESSPRTSPEENNNQGKNSSVRDHFEDWVNKTNVKDIVSDSLAQQLEGQTNDTQRKMIDNHIEAEFDKYVRENRNTIIGIVEGAKKDGKDPYKKLQIHLNHIIDSDQSVQDALETIRNYTTQDIKIELDTTLELFSLENTSISTPGVRSSGGLIEGPNASTTSTSLWNNNPRNTNDPNNRNPQTNKVNTATSVIRQEMEEKDTPESRVTIGVTGGSQDRDPSLGHNSIELAQFGSGDQMYHSITYAEEFLTRSQKKDIKKNGDGEFDPTAKGRNKYKNKNIEYREKRRQVTNAVLNLVGPMFPEDASRSDSITRSEVRRLDRDHVPHIMHLITNRDKFDGSTNQSAWREFATPQTGDINGIYIPKEKEKSFKDMVNTLGYNGNINKLINFLNYFNDGNHSTLLESSGSSGKLKNPMEIIGAIIDIGISVGKTGKMQLIEANNIRKITENLSGTEVNDVDNIFKQSSWDDIYARSRGKTRRQNLLSDIIDPIEKTGNFFHMIADINNDGRIDKFDVGPGITGLAFYNMLLDVCNKKRKGTSFEIINGPQTSLVLKTLLKKARSVSTNKSLTDAVDAVTQQEFVHTYHVAELIKQYPELKAWMLVDIQSEMEYAQSTRQVNNTYEIFNPELARSLLRDETSDPIEDYFTGEAIREAFGDIHDNYLSQLQQIANKEGRTLNRKVSTKFFKMMSVFMDTLFLNFGPLMRTLSYDLGWTDPRFGNSRVGTSGDIPLTKEYLNKGRSQQESKAFIEKHPSEIGRWITQSSIQPSFGMTPGPNPLFGVGWNLSKEIAKVNERWKQSNIGAGVSMDLINKNIFVGVNGNNHIQTARNFRKLQDINTTNTTIKTAGIEYGAGAAFNTNNIAETGLMARLGIMTGREHLMGIEQHKLAFENFLEPFVKEVPEDILKAKPKGAHGRKEIYERDLAEFYFQSFDPKYREDAYRPQLNKIVNMFVGYLQQQHILEHLSKDKDRDPALTIDEKQKIVQAYMGQRIDGFLAAIDQSKIAQLNAQGVKLTEAGISGGINLTPNALRYGGPFGALIQARVKLSTYDEVYGDNPHDINSVSKQLDYGAGMKDTEILPTDTVDIIAKKLDLMLGIPNLNIKTQGDTLILSNSGEGSVLDLLQLYYTPEALEDNGFQFDGNKLIIGDVGQIGVANVFKGLYKTHYLILGSDKMIGCQWHNKGQQDPKTKEVTREPLYKKDDNGQKMELGYMAIEEKMILPSLSSVLTQVDALPDQAKTNVLNYIDTVNSQGQLILKDTTGITLDGIHNNTVPATGTLSFEADYDGNITKISYSDTPSDKLTITHKKLNTTDILERRLSTDIDKIDIDIDDFSDSKELLAPTSNIYYKLKSFDNAYKTEYFEFMAAAKNIADDGITIDTYKEALRALESGDTPLSTHVNNPQFTELLKRITTDGNQEELVYVVNRLKAIFADNYSHGFKKASDITTEMGRRKETYMTGAVLGPSGKPIPSEISQIRNDLMKIKETPTFGEKPNLFGYTAWYASGGDKAKARGYSATALGDTRVITSHMEDIDDKPDTKQWMIDNLKNDQASTQHIVAKLNSFLKTKGITLQSANFIKLLEGDGSIDIGNKKLTIDVSWYFYLLGECANESVGFELNSIQIQDYIDGPQEEHYDIETTTITPRSVRGAKVTMAKATHTIDMDLKAEKADLNIIGQTGVKIQKTPTDGGNPGRKGPIEDTGNPGRKGPTDDTGSPSWSGG